MGILWIFLDIQHCFLFHPSCSTVSEDAGIEPRTVATTALAVRRSNHSVSIIGRPKLPQKKNMEKFYVLKSWMFSQKGWRVLLKLGNPF